MKFFDNSSPFRRRQLDLGLSTRRAALMICATLSFADPGWAARDQAGGAEPRAVGSPASISGRLELGIASLTERIRSFAIRSQGRLQQTGPVVLTLDPAYRRENRIILDFDTLEVRIETRLLVNAPLLRRHRAPPTPIAVSEQGRFTIRDLRRSRDGRTASMVIDYETQSRGTIATGPLAAATHRNRKKRKVDACSPPANKARFVVNVSPDGSVTGTDDPAGASSLLCAVDAGTFTSGGYDSNFTGIRTGLVAR